MKIEAPPWGEWIGGQLVKKNSRIKDQGKRGSLQGPGVPLKRDKCQNWPTYVNRKKLVANDKKKKKKKGRVPV